LRCHRKSIDFEPLIARKDTSILGMWVKKPIFLGAVDLRPALGILGVSTMVEARTEVETSMGEGRGNMLEDIFLLAFCLILAVGGLVTVVWGVATGRFFTIDGLWLALISLTLSAVFGGNIAWSIYTGELQRIMDEWRRSPSPDSATNKTAAGH
jgi:hypothetical protein